MSCVDDEFQGINFVRELMNGKRLTESNFPSIREALSKDMRSNLSDPDLLKRIKEIITYLFRRSYDGVMGGHKCDVGLSGFFFECGKKISSTVDVEKACKIAFAIFNASPPPEGRTKYDIQYHDIIFFYVDDFILCTKYFRVDLIPREAGDTAAPAEKRA